MNLFECCHKCVPPKRKPGCHAHCPEYKEARAIQDEINYIRNLEDGSKGYASDRIAKNVTEKFRREKRGFK